MKKEGERREKEWETREKEWETREKEWEVREKEWKAREEMAQIKAIKFRKCMENRMRKIEENMAGGKRKKVDETHTEEWSEWEENRKEGARMKGLEREGRRD